MYSTSVIAPVPVGASMLQISIQMRWPALNWFAVASTWISYLTISPGVTGAIDSFVNLWNGSAGVDRAGSVARYDAFSQPRVSSRSGSVSGTDRSPTRAVTTDTSGPTSLSTTIQFVSVWSISA